MLGIKKQSLQGENKLNRYTVGGFSLQEGEKERFFVTENHNCKLADGRLSRGVGLSPVTDSAGAPIFTSLSTAVCGCFVTAINDGTGSADTEGVFLVGADGYLYRLNTATGTATKKVSIGLNPTHLCLRDQTRKVFNLFLGANMVVCTVDGENFTRVAASGYFGGCVAGERIFLARKDKLSYSAPLDPTEFSGNSNEGGALFLPADYGVVVGVQAQSGKVYVFMERGIFCVQPSAEGGAFRLEQVDYDGGQILPRSMVATGEGICFLSASGAHFLSDKKIRSVCKELFLSPDYKSRAFGVGRCENTVLIDYPNVEKNGEIVNRRLCLFADGTGGFFAERYGTLSGSMYCVQDNLLYRFAIGARDNEYRTLPYIAGKLRFGKEKSKTLRRLRLFGEGECRVTIAVGGVEHEYSLSCEEGVAESRLREKGREFVLRLFPKTGAWVDGLEIEYFCEE